MSFKKYTASNKFLDKYVGKKKLGKGAYGDVFLVQHDGKEYALKIIDRKKMENQNDSLVQYLHSQVDAMRNVEFQHIVKLHQFLNDNDYYYILLEYCDGGDLMNLQATLPNKVFTLNMATQYLSQVIKGLEQLHSKGYLHRDIKPQNVLVKKVGQHHILKIADFGFCKKAKNIEGTVLGTQQFMSPEIYKAGMQNEQQDESSYGFEVDMWAFGVLMFYMLNLSFPFQINPYWGIQEKYKALSKEGQNFSYKKLVLNSRKKILENCTEEVEDLFRKIFRNDPEKRIRFNQIRQHSLFQKYFPKPNPASVILYKNKFKSSISKKSQFKNKLSCKSSELSQDTKVLAPSTIFVIEEQQQSVFQRQKQIIMLSMEQIDYLSQIASEIQLVESKIGGMQSLMFAFNLIKYHVILLRDFLFSLNSEVYSKKYPGKSWKQYFITQQFLKLRKQYAVKLNTGEIRFSQLYLKCKGQLEVLNSLNPHFKDAFTEEIPQNQDFSGNFFRSYRKSTDLMYSALKEFLKTNKILKFYYFLCVVCICHVFDEFYGNQKRKAEIFDCYISQQSQKLISFSYNRFGYFLRNSNKETLVKLAKKVIEECMMAKP